jgi:hypothetical protein
MPNVLCNLFHGSKEIAWCGCSNHQQPNEGVCRLGIHIEMGLQLTLDLGFHLIVLCIGVST